MAERPEVSRHCFTYGSLMCEDIMRSVTGGRLEHEPAELAGFVRRPVIGEAYPGIHRAPGARVAGILYRDLTPAALDRLDAFEGERYTRELVRVRLRDGTTEMAHTYVFKPEVVHLLGNGDWDFEAFLRHGRRQFESRYLGFTRIGRDG